MPSAGKRHSSHMLGEPIRKHALTTETGNPVFYSRQIENSFAVTARSRLSYQLGVRIPYSEQEIDEGAQRFERCVWGGRKNLDTLLALEAAEKSKPPT